MVDAVAHHHKARLQGKRTSAPARARRVEIMMKSSLYIETARRIQEWLPPSPVEAKESGE